MTLKPHHPYRLSQSLQQRHLQNKRVVFMGCRTISGLKWALVHLLEPDGSCGEAWLVKPFYVEPI